MTDPEIIAYFKDKTLPQSLRIDRATTQFEVQEAVNRNLENLFNNPQDHRSRHRLARIIEALETPYDGPEKPRL
jgi:predicted component of type VI protein secretion system